MSRRDNIESRAPISRFRGDQLAAVDRLPPALRHALWEANIDWDARETRWLLNKMVKAGWSLAYAIEILIKQIEASDRTEIADFGHHWPSRFGRYPHVAAEATLLRYDRQKI